MPLQVKIIDSVNKVLSKNDTPVKLNKGGVCGGVASLYVRYSLEGKKREFFELSKQLANLPEGYQIGQNNAIDKFIREIEIEFNRFNYTKGQYYQGDMEHTVFINGKPIKKEFSIGLVESAANWSNLLNQIRNEGRACYIRSHNHAIALSFVDNEYEIYDPNYDEDNDENPNAQATNTRRFLTADEAINELSQQFGYPDNSDVGLGIIVYANPDDPTPATYPDKNKLLSKSLKSKRDYQRDIGINDKDWKYNSLFFATNINDRQTVEYHLQQGEIEIKECPYLMQMESNNELVFQLYSKTLDEKTKQTLIYYAIWSGNIELFQRMSEDYQKNHVVTPAEHIAFKALVQNNFSLLRAAQSINPVCIMEVLKLYKSYNIPLNSISESNITKIIIQLTKNGNAELLKAFTQELPVLSESVILSGISTASHHDKRGALSFWLGVRERLPKTENNTLISKKLISKVSPLNFQQLIQSGFTVAPVLFAETLKRNRHEYFELSIASNPSSVWNEFLAKLKSNSLEEPIDLLSTNQNLTVLQVLISYKENNLIKRNWPEAVPAQTGIEALKFAYECGNKELVQFFTQKKFKVPTDFHVEQLKNALKENDHQRLEALLSSSIDYVQFFTPTNKQLITELIQLGAYDFIIRSWNNYKNDSQNKQPLTANNLQLPDLLWIAVTQNNKKLYEHIVKEVPNVALKIIKMIIDGDNAVFYPYAIKLAMALPAFSENVPSPPLYQFIRDELSEYEQKLFDRTTKDDEYADRTFRKEARTLIQPLCNILVYAIENHYFSFAEELSSQVHLSMDEVYDLFVTANHNKNYKSIEFLLNHYPNLSTNKEFYLKLAESNEFDLLALLLKKNRPMDHTIFINLLKKAVRAHHEPVIQLLAPYINSAYKIEGSPLYEAIQEKNEEGYLLLIKYDAEMPPRQLFSLAIKQSNERLLEAAFQKPQFAEFFRSHANELLHTLFRNGSPEAVLYFYKKMNQSTEQDIINEYLAAFINFAITNNDLVLFRQLQKLEQFTTHTKELFKQACLAQAPDIVNELLKSNVDFDDKEELYELLDKLFGMDSKESTNTAHTAYDLIYKRALNRLYEFVIHNKYRPFSSLFHSIDELTDDPGLSKPMKNKLIFRALEENDQTILSSLLKQVQSNSERGSENEVEINEEILSLFNTHFNKPLIISVLLDHYNIEQVVSKAVKLEMWPFIVHFLKGRSVDGLSQDLITTLKSHDSKLFHVLETEARQSLHNDPRHELNALLSSKNDLALNVVLREQKKAIQESIMSLQKQMEEQHIDLKSHFYRFDLYYDIKKANTAMEAMIPKIEQFFDRNKGVSPIELLSNEVNRNQIREFKAIMDTNNLVPAYFDERDELESAFDALNAFDKNHEEQQRQKALEEQQRQKDLEEQQRQKDLEEQQRQKDLEEQQRQKDLEEQQRQKDLEEQQRQKDLEEQQRQKDLEEQQRQKDLEEQQRPKDLEEQQRQKDLEEQQRQKDLEEQQRQKDLEEQQRQKHLEEQQRQKALEELQQKKELNKQHDKTPDQQSPGNTPIPSKDQPASQKPNPLSGLIKIVEEYGKIRKKEHYTHYWIPLFQYTKKDKLDATQHFINALKNPESLINNFDKAVLNDGRLHKTIKNYLAEHELAIQSHFKSDKPIKTVNQLINALNKQNPVEKLIYQLEHYHKQRAKQPEMYHFSLFPQYTGTEKRTAVTHLLDVLKGGNNALTAKDIGALNQGSLGSMISEFIQEFKAPLREAMNVKRIDNLTDLINACEHNKTGLSLRS
ncbi:hypothetical protein [Legionella quateirensis]|uniref:Ankyrin repeat-containing protein n=1 Tax=Legionella quateirensis TaxID=45072 RepID=A0A378KSH0_9GAMM|nr:hypothetical protein [Legionella quateirensis]KTD42426.1 ankyrin repeat-containing protein [Legionella quateirensis]STY17119.1 ankyrin repeat-containing protein [Legionella quateirensis]